MATHTKIDAFIASGTWVCPAGVTSVDVEAIGAGAGGTTNVGSGGGGAYARDSAVAVTPGNSYAVTVGTSAVNTNGGDTSFNSTDVVAKGGLSGTNGGTGGTAAGSTGATTTRSGGNGSLGTAARAGGGGAGRAAAGVNGGSGGADNGGSGGSTTSGSTGKPNGGGGNSQTATASSGARGWLSITYDINESDNIPVVKSRARYSGSSHLTHTIPMPTIVTGDLLLMVFGSVDAPTITTPSGWTLLGTLPDAGGNINTAVFWKIAAGGDTGDVTLSQAKVASAYVYAIENFSSTGAPELASATGSSGSMNPPNLTPSTGSNNYWWLAIGVLDWASTVATIGANPTNFDNYDYVIGITNGVTIGVCERRQTASSQDPGTWSNISAAWVGYTLCVQGPQSAASPSIISDTVFFN